MSDVKGLGILVDAFLRLRQKDGLENMKLKIAGGQSAADNAFVDSLKNKLQKADALNSVEFLPKFDKTAKLNFFSSITVLCVPEKRSPAYGLYVLEANAAGIPVVQPEIGVFPELINITEGGTTYSPNTPEALASAVEPFIRDLKMARQTGITGRKNVFEKFDIKQSVHKLADICGEICSLKEMIVPEQNSRTDIKI